MLRKTKTASPWSIYHSTSSLGNGRDESDVLQHETFANVGPEVTKFELQEFVRPHSRFLGYFSLCQDNKDGLDMTPRVENTDAPA